MAKVKWLSEFVCLLTPDEEWNIDINGERKNIAISWLNNRKQVGNKKVYKRQEEFKKMCDTYANSIVVIIKAEDNSDLEWDIIRAIEDIPEELLEVQTETKNQIFSIIHMSQQEKKSEQKPVWVSARDYYKQQDLIRATDNPNSIPTPAPTDSNKKVLPFGKTG